MGVSTFSQYTVVADVSVVAINEKAPLEKVCLLGCGITTGWGAVTKQPGVSTSLQALRLLPADGVLILSSGYRVEDSTVAVFGCGCIGLSCVNAANLVGASRVIAIDVNPAKEDCARRFGATDFINPLQLPDGKRIQDHLVEITDGGLDFTFDATGNVSSHGNRGAFADTTFCSCPNRSTSCAPHLSLATKGGVFRLSSVLPLQGKRSPHGREFNLQRCVFITQCDGVFIHFDCLADSSWSLDVFGEELRLGV
jgi:NADPH:quinone reductase-like Zn-dependent oxidoreductase